MVAKTAAHAKTNGKTKELVPNLGLSDANRKGIVEVLQTVLADESVLVQKLRNYHWNVTGLQFHSLHVKFEEQYDTLWETIDEVAERIRTYGEFAIGTLKELIKKSRLEETPGEYPSAREMLFNLVSDHEAMVRNLRKDVSKIGDEYGDVAAEDLLTGLLQTHQEMAWMLRSFVEGDSAHE